MTLWSDFEINLNVQDVLRGEGVDPEKVGLRRPALVEVASDALIQGRSKIHPLAVLDTFKVHEHHHARILLEGGGKLISPFVAKQFAGAEQIKLVVCTIGSYLEQFADSSMLTDPPLGLALDGLANAAVEILSQQVCERIGDEAELVGLTSSAPLSPGISDWPVEVGQPQIFSLLDPSPAGITLTSSGMMVPKKSISFVVAVGPDMDQTELCELCNYQLTCRYRHAG